MNERVGQRFKMKICSFPGCDVEFMARGKGKYCEEHRKPMYRKCLYKQNDNIGEGIIIIEHNEDSNTDITRVCGLDGCDNEYTITLIPRLFEYSNFCEDHRNEYKRRLFVSKVGIDND
jgi:hypothetical protein